MKVTIPFLLRFREPLLNEKKTWTSRTRKMGEAEDTFEAFGAIFQIDSVRQSLLSESETHWLDEGCVSLFDFVRVWTSIHPRKPYDPQTRVWIHVFHKVKA